METVSKDLKILNAAISVFGKYGFSNSSTKDIAKAAGVAEGTIFRYYKTKKDILYAVLNALIKLFNDESILRPERKIIEDYGGNSPDIILKQLLIDRIKLFKENSDLIKIVITEAQYNEDISKLFYYSVFTRIFPVLLDFIDMQSQKGILIKMSKDEQAVVVRNFIAMTGAFLYQRTYVPNFIMTDEETDIDLMVNIFLNGIKPTR